MCLARILACLLELSVPLFATAAAALYGATEKIRNAKALNAVESK